MGLVQHQTDASADSTSPSASSFTNQTIPSTHPSSSMSQPQPSTTTTTTSPSNPTSLPPAALALATQIFDLARSGDTTSLQTYLQAGIPPNLTNHEGNTLLMLAAYHGHAATVSHLIDAGADVSSVNSRGQTPLAGAVFKGFDDVVGVLVDKGGARPDDGRPSAIDVAKMFRREECLEKFGVPREDWGNMPAGMVLPGPPAANGHQT